MIRDRAGLAAAFAMLVAVFILIGLGTWQVERLRWKTELIARVTERLTLPPVPLPPRADLLAASDDSFDYRPVRVAGRIDSAREFRVFGILGQPKGPAGGPGWWVIVPVTLPDGDVLFVNRGFVPDAQERPETRPAGALTGPVAFTGLLRGHDRQSWLTPAADPTRDRFYARDPAAFATLLGIDPARIYPVTVDMDAAATPAFGLPQAGETLVTFPNSHLGYAITWYGLALALVGVWFAWMRRRRATATGQP